MIISKIKLENIRSHQKTEVTFGEGFNCVIGGVGEGKTSLLYSIHFALFGEPIYRSYEYLLKEDKNLGKVQMEFEHMGKTYKISRTLRRERERITQDMGDLYLWEDSKVIAWGKATAVQEQLKAIAGIDRRLFEEFIWIQQEKLKEILHRTPSERQKILDEVFGLSDFQRAWEKLLTYQRSYEAEKKTLERDVDVQSLPKLREDYNALSSEIMKLQIEYETLKIDLEEAKKEYNEANEQLKKLEDQEAEINELKREQSSIETKINETKFYINKLITEIQQKKLEIQQIEEKTRQLNEQEMKIIQSLSENGILTSAVPEDFKNLIEKLNTKMLEVRSIVTEAKIKIKRNQQTLQTVENENICPICRRTIDPLYKKQLIDQLNKDKSESQQALAIYSKEVEELTKQYEMVSDAFNKLGIIKTQISSNNLHIEEKKNRLGELQEEVSQKRKLLTEKLEQRLKEIENLIATFKVEELAKAKKIREETFQKYHRMKNSIESQERIIKEKEKRLNESERRIQNAEQKLKQKEKAEKILKIIMELRSIYRDVVPSLRKTYIEGLRQSIQSILDALMEKSGRSFYIEIDEEYTPTITEETGYKRDLNIISGGEKTWIALAYRIGLGQLIIEARTGQGLELLILDEPTESLGAEDKSIEALATAISNLKMIRQIITVTHCEELADKATTKILVRKEAGISKIEKL